MEKIAGILDGLKEGVELKESTELMASTSIKFVRIAVMFGMKNARTIRR